MIFDKQQKILHDIAEAKRKIGVSDRMGYVTEVKQEGGEQKMRACIGVRPDGSEMLSPWTHSTDHRGASREQQQFKKGQNVRISGADGDFRKATMSPAHEGKSFPQPANAKDHGYGDSFQMGGKMFQGRWGPEDEGGQGGGGGGGGGGSGSGGGGGGGGESNHRHELWIAKEDHKPPQHSGKARISEGGSGGGGSQGGQQSGQQGGQGGQQKLEEALMVSTDEKNGHTARIGKGDDAVRSSIHEKGGKLRAGKTYFAAEKDKDAKMYSGADVYVRSEKNNYVDKPWQIKKGKDENIPNDDQLGNKKSGGGGGGGAATS